VMFGELFREEKAKAHIKDLLEWKNLLFSGMYGAETYDSAEIDLWLEKYAKKLLPFVCDTGAFLKNAKREGKRVLFEAQLGALRDLDFGIYPYTTSSTTLAAYAPIGAGLPSMRPERVIGVVKAYSTCVGEGPFVCEWFGEEADKLREAGGEYGAKTGRPRRVGPLDLVATRYGVGEQGATEIALTKLDVLSYMDEIPVVTAYEMDGKQTKDFPFPSLLDEALPVTEYLKGWKCDVSGARKWADLPEAAREYVRYIEREVGCFISYVSVGPERESVVIRTEKDR